MSLRAFHIVFVILAIGMSAVLATWGLRQENSAFFDLGLVSTVFGILLLAYGFWFVRKMKRGER